ncbi:MAG: pilus assembly PilX N-terminal domain-containing protein [Pseudomonadota bacterium]
MIIKSFKKILKTVRPGGESQSGMVLVIALMLMSILSLMGASALLTTNTETKISGNIKVGRTAFFSADGAGQATGGILEECIEAMGWGPNYDFNGVTVNDGQFAFETRYLDDDGDGDPDNDVVNRPDISFPAPMSALVDVDKGPTLPVAGSSTITSMGYEGTGKGAAGGGFKVVYEFIARGNFGTKGLSVLFMSYDHYL